jgi:hypothetical protein
MTHEEIIEKLTKITEKQEKISEKLAEISEQQSKILEKSGSIENSSFIDKFMALFALLAFFVALIVYLNGYIDAYGSTLVPSIPLRAAISVISAAITTFFFWLLSPMMIRNLIDSQKPFAGNMGEIFMLFGGYFILVVLNFQLIPVGISLVSFVILTALFVGLYGYLSQHPIIVKK